MLDNFRSRLRNRFNMPPVQNKRAVQDDNNVQDKNETPIVVSPMKERMYQIRESFREASNRASNRASSIRGSLNSSMSNLSPIKRTIKAEIESRRNTAETFTEPIKPEPHEIEDVKFYMSEFYRTIYNRTEEIQLLLKQYPDTLGKHYDNLVEKTGKVSYEDFWLRYFYRCDEERLHMGWKDVIQNSSNNISKMAQKMAKDVEVLVMN